jgi:hypothetical protein
MTFVHIGKDRGSEAEEWIHLISHPTLADPGKTQVGEAVAEGRQPAPVISPEARALSDTVIVPPPAKSQVFRAPSEPTVLPIPALSMSASRG